MTKVAPFTGAWIEIQPAITSLAGASVSLPSRERGLKLCRAGTGEGRWFVAPFAGAWIEINTLIWTLTSTMVAPFTGAWIEMVYCLIGALYVVSLPSRERGLKFPRCHQR